jgi:Fe-S cluster assembly protein SufB
VEEAFNQLGVPVREGREVAVDAIFDSVSVATTYREKLAEQGIIFCPLARRFTIIRNW